jgi:hypothetical protein
MAAAEGVTSRKNRRGGGVIARFFFPAAPKSEISAAESFRLTKKPIYTI